jgi:predicted ABC-type ATPase
MCAPRVSCSHAGFLIATAGPPRLDASGDAVSAQPAVVVLAGPNGAGKSTAAPALLQGTLGVAEFVNADAIAGGLSAFNAEGAAMAAGRVMLTRLKALAARHTSFAFETTLASRSFAPWLRQVRDSGFAVHVVFLWLSSPDLAVQRVAERVAVGGHDIPADVIRRRYEAGLHNFFRLYRPLASTWRFYDASGREPRMIAHQVDVGPVQVYDKQSWERLLAQNKP